MNMKELQCQRKGQDKEEKAWQDSCKRINRGERTRGSVLKISHIFWLIVICLKAAMTAKPNENIHDNESMF